MTYFSAFVLLPQGTPDFASAITGMMSPFNMLLKVEPWREPLSTYEIRWLLDRIERSDLTALLSRPAWAGPRNEGLAEEILEAVLAHGKEHFGRDVGVDDAGWPWIETTDNPLGKWDSWMVGDRFDGMIVHSREEERTDLVRNLPLGAIGSWTPMDAVLSLVGAAAPVPDRNRAVLARNMELVSVLEEMVSAGNTRRSVPAAIITPEPVWGTGVEHRWHEMEPNRKVPRVPELPWDEAVCHLYGLFRDHCAVCLACHT